jgi:hypothetical protein
MARQSPKDEDEQEATNDVVPGSGPRKKGPNEATQLLIAEFRRRSKGLSGAELDAEFERLITNMVERHVGVLPESRREDAREMLRTALRNDPALIAILEDMRVTVTAR